MSKPREFWIERKNIQGDFWEAYEESSPGTIPVIEKSAYDKAVEALKVVLQGELVGTQKMIMETLRELNELD